MIGHDKDASELVEQCLEMRSPHVLVVHDLFQVVVSPEIVKEPGNDQRKQSHIREGNIPKLTACFHSTGVTLWIIDSLTKASGGKSKWEQN